MMMLMLLMLLLLMMVCSHVPYQKDHPSPAPGSQPAVTWAQALSGAASPAVEERHESLNVHGPSTSVLGAALQDQTRGLCDLHI